MTSDTGDIKLSDISDSNINAGNIVSGQVGGDAVGRDKVVNITIINLPDTPTPATAPPTTDDDEPIPPSPYRGLFAFRPEHAGLFFGREKFATQLVQAVERRSFVVVLGASGSGKSSVVFAGLVPVLDSSGNWLFTTFRPGADPFLGLANALVPLIEPELSTIKQIGEARDMADRLREDRVPLSDYLNHIHRTQPDHRLLLIVDQFEELYTLTRDTDTRHAFLYMLISNYQPSPISNDQTPPTAPLHLILTLRADFLSQASLYRPFADALQGTTELLGPMTHNEMTEAIEKPAALRGVTFEANLVERLLEDVGEEEGSLPLLEFALDELWQHQQKRTLTHVAYDEIGGVKGALSRHADRVYRNLSPQDQERARRIFVQLVNPGAGTEDTRRLALRSELSADWPLVTRLANTRLVVTNRTTSPPKEDQEASLEVSSHAPQETVEVVHEALIRHWEQLQGWMAEDRTFRAWQERLRFVLRQWQASQDQDTLLRGAPLAEAEGWLAEREADLSQAERDYIAASRAAREQAEQESKRRTQQIIAGLVVGLILVAIGAVFGFAGQQQALEAAVESEHQSQIALAQSLAALAPYVPNNDTELTTLLAIEAMYANRQSRADWLINDALRQVLFHHPYYNTTLSGHQDGVSSVAFSPNGQTLASSSDDHTIRLWDISNAQVEPRILLYIEQFTGNRDHCIR